MSKVKIFTSSKSFTVKGQTSKVHEFEIGTEVRTWGALKSFLGEEGIDCSGFKAIVAETKATLESSEASLPIGLSIEGRVITDFTILLSPEKVSSGYDDECDNQDCTFNSDEFQPGDEVTADNVSDAFAAIATRTSEVREIAESIEEYMDSIPTEASAEEKELEQKLRDIKGTM